MQTFPLKASKRPGAPELAPACQITLGYNLARIKEATGRLTEASREYRAILESFPDYMDCYFRLAMIARAEGNQQEALEWVHKALDAKQASGGKDANALAFTGGLIGTRPM